MIEPTQPPKEPALRVKAIETLLIERDLLDPKVVEAMIANQCNAPFPVGDDGEPAFAEPWQAHTFASTLVLCQRGIFSWKQWVSAFSSEIAMRPQFSGESVTDAYFHQWLNALEQLLERQGVASRSELAVTREHWRRSYIYTPHGQAVKFARTWTSPGPEVEHALAEYPHHHPHHDHSLTPTPIAVSPSREAAK